MDETYRMLGREHEADLERDARKWQRAAEVRRRRRPTNDPPRTQVGVSSLRTVRQVLLRVMVGVGAVLPAACGGGDGEAAFVERAEAICSRANDKIEAIGRRPKPADVFAVEQPASSRRLLQYYSSFVGAERAALAELEALERPSDAEPAFTAFLAAFERMIDYADQSAVALRARDIGDSRSSKRISTLFSLTAETERRAAKAGFVACTQLGIR